MQHEQLEGNVGTPKSASADSAHTNGTPPPDSADPTTGARTEVKFTPLDAALSYQRARLSVIPIKSDGSKAPACTWKQYQEKAADETQIYVWFSNNDRLGIGIIAGKVSGNLEHLDFDHDAATVYPAWCDMVEAEAPGLLARLCVRKTPSDGYHVSYRCPKVTIPGDTKIASKPVEVPGKEEMEFGGKKYKPTKAGERWYVVLTLIETRGEGGQCVVPGTPAHCHRSGKLYVHHSGPKLSKVEAITAAEREVLWRCARVFDGSFPREEPRPPRPSAGGGMAPGTDFNLRGPDWLDLLDGWEVVRSIGNGRLLRRPGKEDRGGSATVDVCQSKNGWPLFYVFTSNAYPFEPNKAYHKFAVYAMLRHGGNFSAAAKDLAQQGYGEVRPKTPRSPAATLAVAGDLGEHLTDRGNARRVIQRHGADLRYCHPWRKWLVWTGSNWKTDDTAEAIRRVKETTAHTFTWATSRLSSPDLANDPDRTNTVTKLTALVAHCMKWEDHRATGDCLHEMSSEAFVPILPNQLDADPWLYNAANGTLDLRTGELRPHQRHDYITKMAPVNYAADAASPLWERFLHRIMDGNASLIDYLQRVVGYTLTGDVSEQALWFLYGTGQNGKSVFLSTLLKLFGDYGMQAVSELLMQRKHEQHPTERADLFGKRIVCTIETDEGKRIAESLMKQLTGGDKMRVRRMREDFWEFDPTHKLFLAANHKPTIRGTDFAVWRRIKLVPFAVTIPKEERDKELPEKLKAELPGILAWAVRGCLAWQRDGLQEPEEVTDATSAYKREQDILERFLAECCFLHESARIQSAALLSAYTDFTGDRFLTANAFAEKMRRRGFESKRSTGGRIYWHGIGLTPPEHGDAWEPSGD